MIYLTPILVFIPVIVFKLLVSEPFRLKYGEDITGIVRIYILIGLSLCILLPFILEIIR